VSAVPPIADVDTYVRTRASLHAVAEQVLAGARFRSDGHIGLRATHEGFGTPRFGADEQLRVEGTTLVRTVGQDETRHPLTTVRAAAAAIGVEPGAPSVYEASTPREIDRALDLDPAAAHVVAWFYDFGARVLAQLCLDAESTPPGADKPSIVQLWPEHFDLSADLGTPRATYGVSPGDAAHPEPYVYVSTTPPPGAFWNEPFGASLPYGALVAAEDASATALAFFRRGRDELASAARDFSS
jgi:hypothetical protein